MVVFSQVRCLTLPTLFADYFTHGGDNALDFHLEVGEKCGIDCSEGQFDAVGQYSTILFSNRAQTIITQHDASTPLFMYCTLPYEHAVVDLTLLCGGCSCTLYPPLETMCAVVYSL